MAATVADRNSGSGLTNPQAALFAAVNLVGTRSNTETPQRVQRTAEGFLQWLDSHDG